MSDVFDRYKNLVRRAFDRAAPTYGSAAHVQGAAAQRLLAFTRAQTLPAHVRRVLDAGCGTGQTLPMLSAYFPLAQCVALDFSRAMLTAAARAGIAPHFICADIERLPLDDASVDFYWSNLALQWCSSEAALREVCRVLSPGGVARIATLGPRTLHELRTAFGAVDDGVHVIDFTATEHWLEASRSAGLTVQFHAREPLFDLAPDLRTLLGNIKAIGARTVEGRERRRTLGRKGWQALQSAYEAFRRPDGTLPATYDLILLALRKPA
ncbi:MAG: methyltransferase domain-containing protein [Azoarcus sp.]|jgi:malonyl-CoA O-methyltransferase|nr:methyltransferase domain-containing protein [Azoarcus sp.]